MANSKLFPSATANQPPAATTVNAAGGRAYQRDNKSALAQFAATGTLYSTFYSGGEDQLKTTLDLVSKLDSQFIAQAAIYAREQGFMKDMPALLCAVLFDRMKQDPSAKPYFEAVFGRCLDNGKMLKNFVQIVRSGVLGRKSLSSSVVRRLIQKWFDGHTDDQLLHQSIGNDPSLMDVIKLAHVNPGSAERTAFFKWLAGVEAGKADHLGFVYNPENLPQLVKDYERWKATREGAPPAVPFQMLTALQLSTADWTQIATNASWTQTRMNLNTFLRHGVFEDKRMVNMVAARLANPEQIARAKAFPYQLLTAFTNTERQGGMPAAITLALQRALDMSLSNIPQIEGHVVIALDVSGSMNSPVTGNRDSGLTGTSARKGSPSGATTTVSCREVAALIAAAFLRKMPGTTTILPFSDRLNLNVRLNPLDSLATNAKILSSLPSGGTDCSLPLAHLNKTSTKADLVIYVSDTESWIDSAGNTRSFGFFNAGNPTGLMREWNAFKKSNQAAKLVCLDLQPVATTQVVNDRDILSCGGFSDIMFNVIETFHRNGNNPDHWVSEVEKVQLFEARA